jgi:ribosomal protein S18 acetylase RimI-like enzyme
MNIRPALEADIPNIIALQAESWKDAYSNIFPVEYLNFQLTSDLKQRWAGLSFYPEDVILITEDLEMIGFIAVWCRPDPFIENLHVKPTQRSKRVGATLMKSAAERLTQQGHRTAYLWVLESNKRAIQFYERLGGIKTIQVVKNLFGYDVLAVKIEWMDISVILKNK